MFFVTVLTLVTMFLVVVSHIDVLVPAVFDEIDTLSASTVLAAIGFPMFDMIRLHTQVNGLLDHHCVFDDDGFRVNQTRLRVVADVNLTIEPGLSQGDGDTDTVSY